MKDGALYVRIVTTNGHVNIIMSISNDSSYFYISCISKYPFMLTKIKDRTIEDIKRKTTLTPS